MAKATAAAPAASTPPLGVPPAAHAHFNPVDVSRIVYEAGQLPQVHVDRRHMTFNVWSYRTMCTAAGVDVNKLGERARVMQAKRDSLVARYGEKRGMKKLAEQVAADTAKQGPLYTMLPVEGMDQFQQTVHIVWGALLAEDAGLHGGEPQLTLADVEQMMASSDAQAYLFAQAADSLMRYLYGKSLDDATGEVLDATDDGPVDGEQDGDDEFDGPLPGDEGNAEAPASAAA